MNGVVIVAAGTGSRMKKDINKQFIKLKNKEIVAHTIEKFYNSENIDDIVVVIREDEEEYFNKNIKEKYGFTNIKVAHGGNERQDSVFNGIKMLKKECDVVLIHDGARPFVTDDIIKKSINKANEHNAIVVGVKVKDTIKVVSDNGNIVDTPNRSYLWAVQTPQVFKYDIITKAYEDAYNNNYYGTDDAMLVERIGYNVKMIEGSYNNIKITTQEDLEFGEQILKNI
ncbi:MULTISPECIES: 2-C-methyl-D-erythritol 4-phosphate cytidylyltransferase [Paraclostridium]|uniref:2-C-methyl-D-erythritol 4-phosphate cytidylyltransferase n=1 Tax=Paraclostridium bifermentans TaxID=1490 RepID=A0A5P3XFV4_PARBF|nr:MULTISPECIES: 2-C-methyl-D-erythritol 4-phosphate cytidylyltransferase [Paraclostridium]MBN8049492.1 2-C-methyl-D-erythritol 4-phosphate cytidylyltransferase [Paraclostridium bifermentans]MBZ6007492.1 2-C-methyl-D-erythritol 4-phosphate cytidylyltransferase [Paraclostridium bifermentans]MDU0297850.1 2-C-methyl-D-erythritol 4-phosphate cytidylyltransferase [Paraclostridium sp. MRS3W1]NME11185.1 2-C-methyl-D-erythritol 4-phosphate cytidylyltransferase [Paraclostridium bifermentans]QEZ69238.1 